MEYRHWSNLIQTNNFILSSCTSTLLGFQSCLQRRSACFCGSAGVWCQSSKVPLFRHVHYLNVRPSHVLGNNILRVCTFYSPLYKVQFTVAMQGVLNRINPTEECYFFLVYYPFHYFDYLGSFHFKPPNLGFSNPFPGSSLVAISCNLTWACVRGNIQTSWHFFMNFTSNIWPHPVTG